MAKIPVIAIFDVGKTNKKLFLFNEEYEIVHEESTRLAETTDEDGFACEDVTLLTQWARDAFATVTSDERFQIKAINFSAYGASFVYLDEKGKVITPLYNYLKPYPAALQKKFYDTYGGESQLARETASPVLGSLNSGMQLYRVKHEKPEIFARIKYALHLPQYLSHIFSGAANSDITSIGCHTHLWHFQWNTYHQWVKKEGIDEKFPAIKDAAEAAGRIDNGIVVGMGLHDSSAALIPYLSSFTEPFILVSTGTWCISFNPFNHSQLSNYELHQDCLCYLSYKGRPVKASRLFAGYEHEQQVKRLANHFNVDMHHYKNTRTDFKQLKKIKSESASMYDARQGAMAGQSKFAEKDLNSFTSYEDAYHQLIADIMAQQTRSINTVLKGTAVKRIFVDGGFSQNAVYMHLLGAAFPDIEVYATSIPQAAALGAALAIHSQWNTKNLPADIIDLRLYTALSEERL